LNSLTKILAPVVAETQWTLPPEAWPKIEFLVAEDDAPVDRQRLLGKTDYALKTL